MVADRQWDVEKKRLQWQRSALPELTGTPISQHGFFGDKKNGQEFVVGNADRMLVQLIAFGLLSI